MMVKFYNRYVYAYNILYDTRLVNRYLNNCWLLYVHL